MVAEISHHMIKLSISLTLLSLSYSTGTDTGAWLATHNIKGTPANWNGDPSISTISAGAPVGEYCQLVSVGGTVTWRPCSYDDVTVVYGALCYKEGRYIHACVLYNRD